MKWLAADMRYNLKGGVKKDLLFKTLIFDLIDLLPIIGISRRDFNRNNLLNTKRL